MEKRRPQGHSRVGPREWPEVVAFDDLPFAGIARNKPISASKMIWPVLPARGTSGRGGRPLFAVLGAYGCHANGLPDRLWLLRAVPTPSTAHQGLPAQPAGGSRASSPATRRGPGTRRSARRGRPRTRPRSCGPNTTSKETATKMLNRAGIGADHRLRKALAVAFWGAASWVA